MILTCEKTKMNGKETDGTNNVAYYYGFYSETKKRLDFVNISTKAKAGFTGDKHKKNIYLFNKAFIMHNNFFAFSNYK